MNQIHIILFLLTKLTYFCSTSFVSQQISEKEECFVKNQIEYIILDLRVNWEEARMICTSYKNGKLAIVNNNEKRIFLGKVLAETTLEVNDLWIGAKSLHNITDGFHWINGENSYMPDKYFINRGNENTAIERNCLAFSRQFYDIPHFINLECGLNRAMICEKSLDKIAEGTLTTTQWISIEDYKYGIFYAKKTWFEALRECRRNHEAQLASFNNDQQISLLGKFLLIGRPSLQNAWIGGQYKNGAWWFVSESKKILDDTNKTSMFPPWRFNHTTKRSGCLILDRHLSNKPVFVENNCQRRRSYVCLRKTSPSPERHIIILNKVGYIFYNTKKTWDDALATCNRINATFIKVTKDILHDVTYMMGEKAAEVQHIWIGGRLNQSHFYWVEDNEPIPSFNLNINRYPPWYDINFDINYSCLNLDRENHNRPLFYGAACENPQEFICVQRNLERLAIL